MFNKLKSQVCTPKADASASEITRLKIDLEQERLKGRRYRLAAESATNLIYEWDLGSRVEWLGQVDELLGYQPNEIPRTWEGYMRLLHSEDRERVLAAVEKQLKGEEPYSVECRVRRKDGTYLHWQDRGAVVRDESGKPVKWVGAVSDITERKRVELALKSLMARQEAILAATPDIIMEVDNNKIYSWANHAGIIFFGEDVIGKEAASFFKGEQKTYQIVQPVFAGTEDVIYVESWQRRRDGQKRLLAWRCRTLKDEHGSIKGALSTATDITERKQAEERVAKSEAELSGALQMAQAGNWEYDVDKDIFTFNDNFYRIFRTTAAEVGGYRMTSAEYARRFCHPDDAAAVGIETQAAIESADPNYSRQIEHRILYADGEIGTITVRFFIVKDAHGRTVKTFGVNQDITERKRAEEKLKESAKKFRELYDFLPIPVYEMDLAGNITSANRAIYEIFKGTERDLSIGFNVERLLSPEDMEKSRQNIQRLVKGERIPGTEYTLRRLDGSAFPAIVISSVIESAGKPVGLRGAIVDITERKRMETAVRNGEQRLRSYYDGAGDAIIIFEAESGRIRDCNERACLDLGYSREELLNLATKDIENQLASEEVRVINRSFVPGDVKTIEGTHKRKDGSVFPVEIRLSSLAPVQPELLLAVVRDVTDRKLMEATLRDSEDKFKYVFESSNVGKSFTQPSGEIQVNNALCEMLGYSPAELKNKTWPEITHPDDIDLTQREVDSLFSGKRKSARFTTRYLKKDGSAVWADVSSTLRRDAAGKPLYIVSAVVDITERRAAEEAVRQSEARLRAIFDATPFPIALVDPEDNAIEFWSRSALALFGHTAPTMPEWYEFAYPDPEYRREVIERWKPALERARSSGSPVNTGEYQVTCRDGSVRTCELYATFLANRLIVTFNDITEQKRADKARLAIESEFGSLAEAMPQIVWITRPDGWNIYFNRQWVDYTGLTLEESYGHGWNKPFHPDDQQRAWDAWQNATKNGAAYSLECRLRRADGAYRWWLIRGVPYFDDDGKILKWFGTCTDIDGLKRAADALKKSEAGLAEAQRIAHIGNWERDFVTGELHWSDEIYRIFGLESPGSGISFETFLNAVHPDDRESLQKSRKEALSGDKPYDFDHRIVLPSGEIHVVQERGVAQFDKSGTAIRMVGTLQDITERKNAEERILKTLQNLRKAYGGIVQVLSVASEVRDPYTAGHQKRVADMARSIAQEMGLAPECVEGLRLAGSIHDIGKLSVPAEILSKPARLSKIEFALIQSHAQIGHDILKDIDFAWPISRIVLQHHERMDGSGYPQQLKGDDILLEARILAVSDVIEAIASHRPYRPALGIEAALREIEKGQGVLYDPAVVAACLRLFREKRYKLKD